MATAAELRQILRCAVALAIGVALAASAAALDPSREVDEYSHRAWKEQLPQTTVHAIVQDRSGYLWFGTYDGLVRFDGVRFTVFDSHGSPPLPGNSVLALREDRAGRLLIGTDAGLGILTEKGIATLAAADGLPSDRVLSISELADGSVYVGTEVGVARLVGDRLEPVAVTMRQVRGVAADATGRVWVCGEAGLAVLGDAAIEPDAAPCAAILATHDGSLWAGTARGLWRRTARGGEALVAVAGVEIGSVQALLEDRQGSLWVGTRNRGIGRLVGARYEAYGSAQGLSQDLVRALYEDREGSLWIGTNAGLDQLREAKVVAHTSRTGLSNDFVRSIFQSRDGVLWIGTDGGGVDRFENGVHTILTAADGLAGNTVRAIAETSDGAMWFGTRNGVSRLDRGGWRTLTTHDGLTSDQIRVVFADRRGRLFVGTEGGGVDVIAPDGTISVMRATDGLPGDHILGIHEDRSGRIWIGTLTGVCVITEGQRPVVYRGGDGLIADDVFCFHEDDRGGLWLGTERGLALFQGDGFQVIGTAQGLVDRHAYRILGDDDGNLWLTSNLGVSRVALASLYAVIEGRAAKVKVDHFDTSHGMPTVHCNGASQPAGWRTQDGRLWFPTAAGAIEIDPRHLPSNELPPPVRIEEVVVDDLHRPAEPGMAIGPSVHNLELRYTALTFTAPELARFRYRLEGFDEAWIEAGTRRVAYYTKLPPGSYVFRVAAANSDGVWNETGASLTFEVRPASWQTIWARFGAVALAVGTLLLVHRTRLRRLAEANRALEARVAERTAELAAKHAALAEKVLQLEVSEKQAYAAEERALAANRTKSLFLSTMSHELRTPLNSIIGFSQILMERLDGRIEPRMHKFLGSILGSGQHLLGLINDLLDLSKIEAGRMELQPLRMDVAPIAENVCRLMQGMCEHRQVTIETELAAGLPSIQADPIRLKQILFNLLSNAVKFSPPGSAVSLRGTRLAADLSPLGRDALVLAVIDRGIGIAAQNHQIVFEAFRQVESGTARSYEGTGLGLALVRELVELHGGRVTLESAPGAGSTFTVFLPIDGPETRDAPA